MEIEASYIKEVSKVSKTNIVSGYSQTEEKIIVDYSDYNSSEIRNIPYDEAKENYVQIKEQIKLLREGDLTRDERTDLMVTDMQLARLDLNNNDNFNKATYETMRNMDNPINSLWFLSELGTNLQDYYYGKDITASFQSTDAYTSNHTDKELNEVQLSNINVDDFIDKMLATFTDDYASAKSGTIKEQYKGIVDGYSSFKENYDKAVTEPYYA